MYAEPRTQIEFFAWFWTSTCLPPNHILYLVLYSSVGASSPRGSLRATPSFQLPVLSLDIALLVQMVSGVNKKSLFSISMSAKASLLASAKLGVWSPLQCGHSQCASNVPWRKHTEFPHGGWSPHLGFSMVNLLPKTQDKWYLFPSPSAVSPSPFLTSGSHSGLSMWTWRQPIDSFPIKCQLLILPMQASAATFPPLSSATYSLCNQGQVTYSLW